MTLHRSNGFRLLYSQMQNADFTAFIGKNREEIS